jgi:hypothetical protein
MGSYESIPRQERNGHPSFETNIWETHEMILADEALSSFPHFLGVPYLENRAYIALGVRDIAAGWTAPPYLCIDSAP